MGVLRATEKWTPRELRYVSEYITHTFPNEKSIIRARLGSPSETLVDRFGLAKADAMMRPFKRWADAVVITKEKVIIVEAKLRGTVGAISQLEFYGHLFKETPEFAAYANRPVELRLVAPWVDPDAENFARSKGIVVMYFTPGWIAAYVDELKHYSSKEYRLSRGD